MLIGVNKIGLAPLGVISGAETGTFEAPLAFRVLAAHPTYLSVKHRTRDLFASDMASNDQFGSAVALDQTGLKMIVGAWNWEGGASNMGGVYTYSFNEDSRKWVQVGAVLQASDFAISDGFGFSVAISGDGLVLAVGSYLWESTGLNRGAVYIYDWDAGTSAWVMRGSVLTPADASDTDTFGYSVSLTQDGAVLVVGAAAWEGSFSDQGGVYTFDWSGGAWVQRGAVLAASDGSNSDGFGYGVAISGNGNVLIVGSTNWEGALLNQGAVYIYDLSGGAWVQRGSVLTSADAAAGDNFGNAVATNYDGSAIAIGARFWEGVQTDTGAVYLYDWVSSAWSLRAGFPIYRNSFISTGHRYGEAVAMGGHGTSLAVGIQNWVFGTATGYGGVTTYDIFGKRISGTVTDLAVNAIRTIRAYDRDTGYFVGGCISASDGTFTMGVKTHKDCFVVAYDDLTFGAQKNAVIADKITPY